ncbi:MAG: arginine--tRNA ligase [Kofleriaceae bacterium]|nr:arginine--tRNA ligase [Kofleriaceae bacterium]MBP6841019.1 arginine--tRNA ligase [Kofleriaceae bacterium]MBP9203367.1 arginine--tRNA ligase [Kofleriaceae bacterium]
MTVPGSLFQHAISAVVSAATGVPTTDLKVEAPPRPDLGDYAVGCFPAAKRLGKAPALVAQEIAAAFQPTELLASASAAGPFVNFKVDRGAGFRHVIRAALAGALVPTGHGAGQTICIDYSSPNISKHLAYHHIRSTCIGHSLAQIFRALGYRVVGINHLGDWGTTHGMLIAAARKWGIPDPLDVTALNELYVRYREAIKAEPALEAEARAWFKKLEDGDAEARGLWQRFRDVSWAEFAAVYDLLGIRFDEVRGESAYESDLAGVLAEFAGKGLVSESEGAQVVVLEGEKTPLLLVTKDGTTLYATRDLAAAQYRWNQYEFTRSLYVVDRGQALHFRQLFKALALAGHGWASRCEHVPFGLVRFGGKKTSTRGGNVVLLKEVFAEAAAEVRPRIAAKQTELDDQALDATARAVGIGAVVFANLVTQRDKDVDFDWDKAMSLEGDSGPYLMYSHARCASLLRRAAAAPGVASFDPAQVDPGPLATDAEWAVARRLLDLGDVVVRAGAACEPHQIAHYLLDLAADFSRWYTAGGGDPAQRVLCDDGPTRAARLALTAAVQATMARGLALLGLDAPTAM